MNWSYAWAIEPGNGKAEPEDAGVCLEIGEGGLAMAVADGAGSASHGGEGAKIVCDAFAESASRFLEAASPDDVRNLAIAMVTRFHAGIEASAAAGSLPRQAFATTFLGAIASPDRLISIHIGDGAAVAGIGSCLKIASAPVETEFVNVTRFVTDADVFDQIRIGCLDEPVDRVCLMTDGLQPLVIDDRTGEPHQPFFERVFGVLNLEERFDARASMWLSGVLRGDSVRKRTDDDTTIAIARRRA